MTNDKSTSPLVLLGSLAEGRLKACSRYTLRPLSGLSLVRVELAIAKSDSSVGRICSPSIVVSVSEHDIAYAHERGSWRAPPSPATVLIADLLSGEEARGC